MVINTATLSPNQISEVQRVKRILANQGVSSTLIERFNRAVIEGLSQTNENLAQDSEIVLKIINAEIETDTPYITFRSLAERPFKVQTDKVISISNENGTVLWGNDQKSRLQLPEDTYIVRLQAGASYKTPPYVQVINDPESE